MSEPLHRAWLFYISDMQGFAEKVMAYTDGLDQEEFMASNIKGRRQIFLMKLRSMMR